MDFDLNLQREYFNTNIKYGIIKGNSQIVLIKPGQDGSLRGYDDKYIKIAKALNLKYNFTVICSSNPYDFKHNPLEDAIDLIRNYISDNNIENPYVIYIGNSIGGMLGARYGYLYPEIKKMLLINIPLLKNCDLILSGLRKFTGDKVSIVYGSEDASIKYVKFFDNIDNENIKYHIIDGENHNFSNNKYDFKKLPDEFLFNS